jgi:hypothetical protein
MLANAYHQRKGKNLMRTVFPLLLLASTALAQWKDVPPAAKPGSGMPNFARSADGHIFLSWIDPSNEKSHALRFSRWTGASWSAPETISEGSGWFVNWADFPAMSIALDGSMLAHWLVRAEAGGKYGYGIRVARREAGTQGTWKQIAAFNENDTADYAGFLSFAGLGASYLSPPVSSNSHSAQHQHGSEEGHLKTLRFAEFNSAGKLINDRQIDGDVCSCCQTSSAETPSGILVAYRDHQPGEIRDISIVRIKDGQASAPQVLHRDGWQINGCPTEGPSVAAFGNNVGIAWLTRAGGVSRLKLSLSQDGGRRFRPPLSVDDGTPLGRPHLIPISGTEFLLAWLEREGDSASIRLRRVSADGQRGSSITVARVPASRTTGLPRVALHGAQVLVAWREEAVRAGWLPLSSLPLIPQKVSKSGR